MAYSKRMIVVLRDRKSLTDFPTSLALLPPLKGPCPSETGLVHWITGIPVLCPRSQEVWSSMGRRPDSAPWITGIPALCPHSQEMWSSMGRRPDSAPSLDSRAAVSSFTRHVCLQEASSEQDSRLQCPSFGPRGLECLHHSRGTDGPYGTTAGWRVFPGALLCQASVSCC